MGKNAKLKEKQKWAEEKIHLDNARKLRGIYFIDPEDKEYKEIREFLRKSFKCLVGFPQLDCLCDFPRWHGWTGAFMCLQQLCTPLFPRYHL